MRTRIQILLVAAALLGAGATPARGQNTAVDSRWLAYLGCWESIESTKSLVCFVPAAGGGGGGASAVDLVTITKGEVVSRERIATNGERVATRHDDCTGWQSVEWSSSGARLFMQSGDTCPTGDRTGTGLIAMAPDGHAWLYIQAMTLQGQTGVRAQRYREVSGELSLPDEVKDVLTTDVTSTMQARAAAALPLGVDDVIEASRHLDTPVLETWLVERGEPFALDAKQLVKLADAEVPGRVTDLMVALSYPKVFAINTTARAGERLPRASAAQGGGGYAGVPRHGYTPLNSCSLYYMLYNYVPYDCAGFYPGYGSGYGYGYGYGFYPGSNPVLIVFNPPSARAHGRVVNGQGYKEGASTNADAMPRSGDWGKVTPSGWSTGSAASSSSSSSSGSGEQRTAKPQPQ